MNEAARAPWHADEVVDADRAEALISARFFRPTTLDCLGEGWDSTAFLVDRQLVFRFPKRAQVVPHLRSELAVLPQLQHLPLAVPQPLHVAEPGPDYPFPFMGYPHLSGQPADEVELDGAEVIASVRAFLDALHAVEITGAVAEVRGWPDPDLAALEHPIARKALAWLDAHPQPDVAPVLLHDDLGAGHILVRGGRPVGVVDWGDMALGDPARDLVGLYIRWPDELAEVVAPELLHRVEARTLRAGLGDCLTASRWLEPAAAAEAWARLEAFVDLLG